MGFNVSALMMLVMSCVGGQTQRSSPAVRNFIFFGRDRERIREANFLETKDIVGTQLKYAWKELEPERDHYEFEELRNDLAFLDGNGKRLFIQVQDVSFDETIINVPRYLLKDPAFGGGVARQYEFDGPDDSNAKPEGWVARRWDPAVRERFIGLLRAIGKEFDGKIEGINLPETAIDFGRTGRFHPAGFTYDGYAETVKAVMTAAREAFSKSIVIQYANFMPGEALPENDHGYLRGVYEHAERIGVGVGGPDLLPYREGQLRHSYPMIAARGPHTVAGVAVQWGNLEHNNPATGKRVTVPEVARFAGENLHLNYVFWGTQEPYYSEEVLPYLRGLDK